MINDKNPIQDPKHFTVLDARTFDGDPYDVAKRAVLQAAGIAEILGESLDNAMLMVRNAELERQMGYGGAPDVAEWEASALNRKLTEIQESIAEDAKKLTLYSQAAGFNPKARV